MATSSVVSARSVGRAGILGFKKPVENEDLPGIARLINDHRKKGEPLLNNSLAKLFA